MQLYFSIIYVAEMLIVNYVGNAIGTIKIPKTNATEIVADQLESTRTTTDVSATITTNVTFNMTATNARKGMLTIKKGRTVTATDSSTRGATFTNTVRTFRTTTTFRKQFKRQRTFGLLFPNLRNATAGGTATAPGAGLFGANGLLALLLTNLVSNDNIGVIATSLINANLDRRTTAAPAVGATTVGPVKNVANNYYGVGAAYPYATYAGAGGVGGYPYYYGGYENYYAPYGYYYG